MNHHKPLRKSKMIHNYISPKSNKAEAFGLTLSRACLQLKCLVALVSLLVSPNMLTHLGFPVDTMVHLPVMII